MGETPDRPAIPPLTSLRFFAASLVVAFHYDPDRFTRLPGFVQNWLETGYEAVTFFFVLSGFVLSYVYFGADPGRTNTNLRSFFVARFGRLFPAYYLSLLIALPFFILPSQIWGEAAPANLPYHALAVLGSVQAWWPEAALAWNPPAWSVSVEWFLYATFPIIAWATRFVPNGTFLAGSFLLVTAGAAFRVLVMEPLMNDEPDQWRNFALFFPLFHLPQFIFGVALGRVHLLGPRSSPALAGWMFTAGLVGLMIVLGDLEELPTRIRSNAVLVIFFGMLIFGAAQSGHGAYRALSVRPLVYLGDISYSMYILHQPLEFYWEWVGPRSLGWNLPYMLDFVLFFALVVGLSALSYRIVETPLRRRIRRWGGKDPAPPAPPAGLG